MKDYQVCVIGVGDLGARIAGEMSLYGFKVNVFDSDENKLNNVEHVIRTQKEELIKNGLIYDDCHMDITAVSTLREAVKDADFIFEVIVDNLQIKQWLYEKVTHNCKCDAVICSNTLNLSIEDISSYSLFKDRIIGCRFLMPVYRIPFVELTYTKDLSTNTLQKVKDFFNQLNKNITVRGSGEEPRMLTHQEVKRYWQECNPLQQQKQQQRLLCDVGREPREIHVTQQQSRATHENTNTSKDDVIDVLLNDQNIDEHHGGPSGHGRNNVLGGNSSMGTSKDDIIASLLHDQDKDGHHGGSSGHGRDNVLGGNSSMDTSKDDIIASLLHDQDKDGHHGGSSGHGRDTSLEKQEYKHSVSLTFQAPGASKEILSDIISAPGTTIRMPENVQNTTSFVSHANVVLPPKLSPKKSDKSNHRSENFDDQEKRECVVCQDASINAVLDPCGHMWLCFDCATTMKSSKKGCPACRRDIEKVLRVYLP